MIISTLYNLLLKNLQTSKVKFAILFCVSLIGFTEASAGAVYDRNAEINHPSNSTHFTKNKKSSFSHNKSIQPVSSANFLSASTQCLSGNSFDFISNSTISSGSIVNQFWDFGDGKSATGPSVTHSYFTAGSFQVKLIVTSDKGCIDSITRTVTIYPQPLAAYIIPANQCLTNNNFNFTSSASIGSGGSISSVAWDFGDGNIATGSSISHSFTTNGKYPVNLQVTSDNGCTDIITDTITVFQVPNISVTNNSPICSGNSLTLNSVTTSGTTPYNYTWNGPNSFSSNLANPSISNISINANGNYSVSVTDSNGCTSSVTSNVIVNLTPVLAPIVGSIGGCVGSSINLTNSTAGGSWSSSNNSIATVDASSGIVNFISTGNVSITYNITNAGCSTSVSTNLISNSVSLKSDIIECNNGITHFNATDPYYGVSYSNNNAGTTYLWTITGGPFSFQGASSANNRYTDLQLQTGNAYTIKIQFTSNGISCTAQQMVYKNTRSADTIQGSHDTTVCNNTAAIPLSGVVSAASNSFQWTSSGSGTFSNNESLHTAYTPSDADKLAGIVKIYFTATSNLNSTSNCGYALGKDSMTLRIYPANMAVNSNQTICSNQPINFSPSTSIPGSFYSWSSSILSGSVNGNSATGTGTINDSLVNTSNSSDALVVYNITPFAFTPSNITCTGNPFNYTVIVKPKPRISISNTTASICTGGNSNIQFNSSIANTLFAWSSAVITGAVNGNSSSANFSATDSIKDLLNNSFNANATIRYYISAVSNSSCTSIDSTDILLYALPTIANAGTDQVLCNVNSSILSANIPGVGSGKWEILSGPSAVVFGTPSSPFSTVTGLVAGTYQLIWSISNGSCSVSKDTIQIINNPESIGGSISANTSVCTGLNNGTVTLSGYTGNIKGWESSTDGGITWPTSINNSNNNYTYNNLTSSTLFRAIIQSGNCSTVYSTPVSITVNNNSNPGILLKDTVVCISSNSGSLNLTGFSGNILRWETSTDAAASWQTINNAIGSSLLYTNITGTTLYRAIVQNGTCNPASSNYITIHVSAISNPGILAANAIVCTNNNNGILNLSGYTGKIVAWETSTNNGTSWNSIVDSSNQFTYNNLSATTAYRATVQSGSCPSVYSNTAIITVLQPATISDAGADQKLCNLGSTSLTANTPASGTGTWNALTSNPSTVNFTNINDPHSSVTGLVTGTYQFVWSISNTICADSKDTVSITVYAPTVAGTLSADAIVCATSNNNTLIISGFNGTILKWESSINNGTNWDSISNINSTYSYNNLNLSTSFRALVQNQICPAVYSNKVTITVLQTATASNAGPDQILCNQTATALVANTAIFGTGRWTALNSNPSAVVFSNVNDSKATVSGLIAGVYQFVWTISNTLCADSKDTVQIINNQASNPGILTSDATVCANSNNGTLHLNGYLSNIQQWESSINGTYWNLISNTNSSQNYSNLTTSTYYRALVNNGICTSLYSNTIRITVLPAATIADAGPDTTLINGFSSYKLEGNYPSSGTGCWSVIPPFGPSNLIFTDTTDSKATIRQLTFHYADSTTVPITPPSDGIYYLKWTISNGICPASESIIVVTVQPPTNPGFTGTDTVICSAPNNAVVKLTNYFGDILQWEDSTANIAGWHIIQRTVGTDQDTIHFENLTATTIYRALVKNGVGLSLYSGIAATITVLDPVSIADAGADSSICNTSSIQLYGNNPSNGTGTWTYLSGAPTTPIISNIKDPKAIISGLSIGKYQFVWTISNGSCNNSIDTVTITIQAPTNPGTIASSNTVCLNNNAGILQLTGYTGSVLGASYSTDDGLNWLPIINSANKNSFDYNNLSITTKYRAEVKNGVCPSLFSNTVTITVLQIVSIANAGIDQSLCNQTATTLAANAPNSGTGIWTALSNNPSAISFSDAHDPNATISGLIAGTYQLAWTISNMLCADSKDTVSITVFAPTIAGTLSADAIVCANNNTNTLTLNGAFGSILQWESSKNNGISWDSITNLTNTYAYNNLTNSTSYRALIQHQICSAIYSNIVNITVLQAATISDAGIDQSLCNQTATKLAANAPNSGTGSWTAFGNNPSAISFSDAHDPNATISGLIAGTYQLVWTISNMLCADSKDTVQIIVYPPVSTGNLVADDFVCIDSNTGKLALTNYKGEIIQWESSIDNGINWIIIPSTNSSYTYRNLLTRTQFRVLLKSGPCNTGYSNLVTISVNQLTAPGTISSTDSTACKSYNNGTINLTGYTGTIIHWEYSEDNGKNWIILNNSTNHLDYTNLTTATEFRVLVQSGVCSLAYSNQLPISITAATIAGTISGTTTVCSNNNNGSLTLIGNNGNILHWESSSDNGNNWTIIANTSNLLNYQSLNTTTVYRALVQNGLCAFEYTNTVTINVAQAVTIANAGPDQVICNSSTTTILKANNPVSGEGIWSMLSGPSDIYFNDATLASTAVNGLVPGTYQFAWKIDNGTCAASSSIVSIIVDKLKVDFTLSAINDCGSTTYQFADASKALFGIANFKWSSAPGDTTTNNKNYTKVYAQPGQNKVSLTVQSNTGCTVTTGASYQVKVFFVPKVNINAINEACKNQLLQLSPTLNSKDSINAILWNLGNGINTKDSIVSVQYYSEGKYTIKLLVSTVNKCYDSTVKDIAIRPLPVVLVPAETYVCKGDTLRLTATGATNYIWKDQQNNIVCNGCNTFKILTTSNSVYSVIGYNQYGCSQIANTNSMIVQPIKIVASLIDTLCQGTSIKLKVAGADTYTWMPDAGLSNYNSANPIASPLTTTIYTVVGKEKHACFTDTARIKLVVGKPTTFNIGTDTVVQSGVGFKIMANSNELQNIRKWQWGGSATFSCINCQTTIAKAIYDAAINCIATNIYGCTSTDTIEIKTFCPNSEIFIPNAFSPDGDGINDILFVQGSGIKLIKSFRIFSRWGELVFERTNFQTGDPSNGWDGKIRGKAASQDVFVYICEAICEKGTPATFKGNIAVLK
ncbi:MAG: PKD domain-containing protein [Bacteroidota bacterium]